jgi:hypothetical protein
MLETMLLPEFCKQAGYTANAARCKIKRGDWRENVVWRKSPDGRIHIILKGYDNWVKSTPKVATAA